MPRVIRAVTRAFRVAVFENGRYVTYAQNRFRFSRKVCLYMLGVSERAESRLVLRWRRTECGLSLLYQFNPAHKEYTP